MLTKQSVKLKRSLSGILALTMTFASMQIDNVSADAQAGSYKTYVGNGYTVRYEVTSVWNDRSNISVTLTNTGDEAIRNWALLFDPDGDIENIWNGVVGENDDKLTVIRNNEYNYEVLPNDSISFGYTVVGADELPETMVLSSQNKEYKENDYTVTLNVENDWDTGFSGNIAIEATGDVPIEAWKLGFDANFDLTRVWNAEITESKERSYTVESAYATAFIHPGETKSFGISAAKDSKVSPEITNISLNGVAVNGDAIQQNSHDSSTDESSESENSSQSEIISQPDSSSITESIHSSESSSSVIDSSSLPDDSSKAEPEPISIEFDMTGFEKNDLDMYAVIDPVYEINGSLKGKDRVSKLEYTVKNMDDKTVSNGELKVYDKWTIDDFGLDIGINEIIVTAYDNEGEIVSNSIKIINANIDNLSRTDADLGDDDGDKLQNYFEDRLGFDPKKADTDGDGLSDYDEFILIGTDPLDSDTDKDGISDDAEDPDVDGLSNIKEMELGTYAVIADSDSDNINDGDEVNKYGTDPLKYDTDGDGLNDFADINMGFDPNKADTDEDGVTDSEEIIHQEVTLSVDEPEIEGLVSVNIDTQTNGDININTFLLNVYGIDSVASSAPGLIGVPVDINFGTEFDKAKVTFEYDDTKLGDTDENDLGIIWHDKEHNKLVLLDNTIVDAEKNTVTYDTTHFSTYAIVDKKKYSFSDIKTYIDQTRVDISNHITVYTDVFAGTSNSEKNANAVAFCDRIIELWDDDDFLLFSHSGGGAGGYKKNFSEGVINDHCRKMISGEEGTERVNPYIRLMTLGLKDESDYKDSELNTTVIMTDGTNTEKFSYVDNYVKNINQAHNIVYVIDFGEKYDADMAGTIGLCGGRYLKVKDKISAIAAANDVKYNTYTSQDNIPEDDNPRDPGEARGLSEYYIFVDGIKNANGDIINEKMEYLPYPNAYELLNYSDKIPLTFFNINKTVYGRASVHDSFKSVLEAIPISVRSEFLQNYAELNTYIYLGICALTPLDYDAHDVFYSFAWGIGGDSKGIQENGTRKVISASKYLKNENLLNGHRNAFQRNMFEAKIAVEDKIRLGYKEAYIANSRDHIMSGGEITDHELGYAETALAGLINRGAYGTFDSTQAGNVIHYSYDENTNRISMRCKYYLFDYYDFDVDVFSFISFKEQDAVGYAKSFELFGVCEAEYTWTKGQNDFTGYII